MESPGLYDDWTGNIVKDADVRSLDPGAVRAARASYRERFPDRAEESDGWDDETFLARWENTDAPDHAIAEAAARYSDTRVNAIRLSMGVAFVICLAGSLTTSFITKDRSKE